MMGRRRKHDKGLPQRLYCRRGAYYYVHRDGRWEPLGRDRDRALARYQALHAPRGGMPALMQRVLAAHRPQIADATYTQYRIAAAKLSKILAEFAPDQVTPRDVAQIKHALAATPNMANRCLSFLRLVFAYALEWGECASNPCIGIRRHTEIARGRYITDEEYAAIYAKAGPRLQVIMELCYCTAQRITDVLGIRASDLLEEGIRFQPRKTTKRDQRGRESGHSIIVARSPRLDAAIERAKALPGPKVRGMTLLLGRRGRPPSYTVVKKQWDQARRAAGVEDVHIHDLRAKALTDARREGLDATALAAHTNARMTERYIRLRETPVVQGPGGSVGSTK